MANQPRFVDARAGKPIGWAGSATAGSPSSSQDFEFSARAAPLKRMRGVPFVRIMEKATDMLRGPRALAIAARFAFFGARMMSQIRDAGKQLSVTRRANRTCKAA